MATYTKFQPWVEYALEAANCGSDQFVVGLTNSAPSAANGLLSDLTPISYTNLSSRNLTTASSAQSGGTYSLTLNDLTLTASGAVATFRYIFVYDDTVTNDPLVAWYDYGSAITMASGDTFLIDFTGALFTLA